MSARDGWAPLDPFDLPDWMGTEDVTWAADSSFGDAVLRGALRTDDGDDALACDLLAADVAYPEPVLDESTRIAVHQAWRLDQVHLLTRDDRLTLAVPTIEHTVEGVLEVIGRLAQAVGAPRDRFAVRLRAGR